MKYALNAREGDLTIDVVSQHLLTWELDNAEEKQTPVPTPSMPQVQYSVPQMSSLNNPHFGPMQIANPAIQMPPVFPPNPQQSLQQAALPASVPSPWTNSIHVQASAIPGPIRNPAFTSVQRYAPYTPQCHACGKMGHTQAKCWTKFPYLQPQWAIDKDAYMASIAGQQHHQQRHDTQVPATPYSNPQQTMPSYTPQVYQAQPQPMIPQQSQPIFQQNPMPQYSFNQSAPPSSVPSQTAHFTQMQPSQQTPLSLSSNPISVPPPPTATAFHATMPPYFKYEGPDVASKTNYSNAFMTLSLSEDSFTRSPDKTEYCWSLNNNPGITSTRTGEGDGEVGSNDEPGKWLVDSGASSHFSPFKYLFLSLIPCVPPVQILTGNGFITAFHRGNIPLILKVADDRYEQVMLENVLYVPTLKSRVNLFSIVVLADKEVHSNFGPSDVLFQQHGKVLASGSRIGNSWWLNADINSHQILSLSLATCFVANNAATPEDDDAFAVNNDLDDVERDCARHVDVSVAGYTPNVIVKKAIPNTLQV
ncbi:hypothetical protein DFH27DRAFT_612154 [Peziza echinospora]|nr:hypothetical protein DFH27DRAFT_612154 [Peziza echinospora]